MPPIRESDLSEALEVLQKLNREREWFDDIVALQGSIERREGAEVTIRYRDGTVVNCSHLPGDYEDKMLEAVAEEHRKNMEPLRRTLNAMGVKTVD